MIDRTPRNSRTRPRPPARPVHPEVPRWFWVLVILLAAVVVGGVAGLLSYAAGNNVPTAILTGGGAFAGTVALLLAIAHYAGGERGA